MSHLIEDGVDTVYTPNIEEYRTTWHKLETIAGDIIEHDGSNVPNVFCPIRECGLKPDFNAEIANVSDDLKADGACDLSAYKLILADCRNGLSKSVIPLHVPKKGYKIHQNRELFDCAVKAAIQVLGANGFEIVTVGTLGGYSQFFLSIAIKGQETFDVGNLANGAVDTWKRFFNLNSSHNGLIGSNRLLSTIRAVCMNTVMMSISDATNSGTIATIKHTMNSGDLITPEAFAKDLNSWIEHGKAFQLALTACKASPMNLDEFRAFGAGVFTNAKSDELSTNSFNRITEMESLFSKGQGNQGNSRYDAINAFTEFFTSGNGAGSNKVKANKRVAMANFGRGNDWKLDAIKCATSEELFTDALNRGTILYSDKSKVIFAGN